MGLSSRVASFCRVLLLPFYSGRMGSSNNEDVPTDSEISSTLTFSHLVSCLFVVIGVYAAQQTVNDHAHLVTWSVVMGLVSLGFLSIFVLIASNRRHEQFGYNSLQEPKDPSLNLKIMFLWLFGMAVIIHVAMNMAVYIECVTTRELNNIYMGFSILGSAVLIMFLIMQMSTITYFRNSVFQKTFKVNFAIVFVLLANLAIWFNTAVSSINALYQQNATFNESMFRNETDCYHNSRVQTDILRKIIPYLLPARMEFCILASTFMITMWQTSAETCLYRRLQNGYQELSESFALENLQDVGSTNSVTDHSKKAAYVCASIFALIVNLPVFCLHLLLSFVYNWKNDSVYVVLEVSECVSALCSAIIIYKGLHYLLRHYQITSESRKFTMNEYILIFSSSGMIAYCTYGFLAGIEGNGITAKSVLYRNIFTALETFLQTFFIIQFNRYISLHRGSVLLASFGLMLTITNLMYWFLNSYHQKVFSEGRDKVVGGEKNWLYVQNIILPLIIFYRFTSAMNTYALFCRFNR